MQKPKNKGQFKKKQKDSGNTHNITEKDSIQQNQDGHKDTSLPNDKNHDNHLKQEDHLNKNRQTTLYENLHKLHQNQEDKVKNKF